VQQRDEVRSDAELVLATRAGDRAAFGLLIDRHRGRVEALVRKLLRTREDTEDVTQEALLQAYLGLDRLREPERFGSWVGAIAANLAKMRLRQYTRPPPPPPPPVENGCALGVLEEIRAALAELTPDQRRVVLMHDLEGRTAAEIGRELDEAPGTVRVRLHRARARLRSHLAELEPKTRKERRTMVEVDLDDVVVRVLAESDDAAPTLTNEHVRVVVLRDREGTRILPIWVGPPEGDALALHLGGDSMPRPLTADLMARLLEAAGAKVERVTINSLREKTFYAVVAVAGSGGPAEVDARPSDALNLAARIGAPIFVDDAVMDESGIESAERNEQMQKLEDEWLSKSEEVETPPSRWLSLTPELVKSFYPQLGKPK
jgi:RNA polymerase sigma factor (sigma-70 family)